MQAQVICAVVLFVVTLIAPHEVEEASSVVVMLEDDKLDRPSGSETVIEIVKFWSSVSVIGKEDSAGANIDASPSSCGTTVIVTVAALETRAPSLVIN